MPSIGIIKQDLRGLVPVPEVLGYWNDQVHLMRPDYYINKTNMIKKKRVEAESYKGSPESFVEAV